MQGGGTRGLRVATAVISLAVTLAGCSDSSEPARAAPPETDTTTSTTTTTTSTTTTTTEATTTTVDPDAAEFEPLYADPDLDLEAQIEAAYLHHWDILLDAYRTGRTDYLHLVYTDEAVQLRVDEITRNVDGGYLVDGHVEHNYEIAVHNDSAATVMDGYWNHLVKVDPESGEALEAPTGEQVLFSFDFRKEGDQWLVDHVEHVLLPE